MRRLLTLAAALVATVAPCAAPALAQEPAKEPAKVPVTAPTTSAGQLPSKQRVVFADTLTFRLLNAGSEADVLSIVYALRDRETRLLREFETTAISNVQARQALAEELQRVSREAFAAMSVIESRCQRTRETPSGYLGVNLTTSLQLRGQEVTSTGTTVTSVEPGSPAEAAGLRSGDVLLAIAGRDARERLPDLQDVLEPGRRVVVRVQRGGAPVDVSVTVAPRPRTFESSCTNYERALLPLRMGAVGRVWIVDSAHAAGTDHGITVRTAPRTPFLLQVPSRDSSPPTLTGTLGTAPSVMTFGTPSGRGGFGYFGGAQFRVLDDDWRNVLGVRADVQGVLVNEVAPGSAAAQSGLKVGDVITEVGGNTATSPYVVVRLLGVTEGQQATLQVIRARERRTVTLRWGPSTP